MTANHAMDVMHSSEESDWRTPAACFEALDREFHFHVDAAADAQSSHCGPTHFGPGSLYAEDALSHSWRTEITEAVTTEYAGETVPLHDEQGFAREVTYTPKRFFLNPPFSRKKARLWEGADQALNPYRIENWARKCWEESALGCTVVGLFPFAPQTSWYRQYVYGHAPVDGQVRWSGHAAKEERRLPHRISFLRPDGTDAANAGVNTAIIVWTPMRGAVGPWTPHSWYWSYR